MKVKDFLGWFSDLDTEDLNYVDEDGNVHLTLAWCD